MSMVRPIGLQVSAFDSINDNIFYFASNGGNQIVKNKIIIRDNITNAIVYQNTQTTFQFQQTVIGGTLQNNKQYNVSFITYDISDNASEESVGVLFKCITTPTFEFTNVTQGGNIGTATYIFTANYNQVDGENVDTVIFKLYNNLGFEIANSGGLYNTNPPPINFNFEYSGLENNTSYKIKAECITTNGLIVETDLISFNVVYTDIKMYSDITLTPNCQDGYINIKNNFLLIEGKTNPIIPITYKDNNYIDLTRRTSYVLWDGGYTINKNFTLQLWCKPSLVGDFCEIGGLKLKLVREIPFGEATVKDYVVLYTNDGRVNIKSNYVDLINNNTYYIIYLKKVDDAYTLTIEVISTTVNTFEWNITSNLEYDMLNTITYENENYVNGVEFISSNENVDNLFPTNFTKLYNGLFDMVVVTNDVTSDYSVNKPIWDENTILLCDFLNNVSGGNVDIILDKTIAIKVKKREVGTLQWVDVYEQSVSDESDLNLNVNDFIVKSYTHYDYAIIPVLYGNIDGDYNIKTTYIELDGCFINTKDKIFKLYNGVIYSGFEQNKPKGIFNPIGVRYPIIIENSNNNYKSGSISFDIYGYTYEETNIVNRRDVIRQSNDIVELLTSNQAIIYKDWNGNILLIRPSSNVMISYREAYGNGVQTLTFSFMEQGMYNNEKDLIDNDLI